MTLSERAEAIIRRFPERASLKSVIEKELIHYDIFFIMQQQSLRIPNMTFIGGTCLRLCHGSHRYSEDLDFHAGFDFQPQHFEKIRIAIGDYLAKRYGLPIEVREPKQLQNDADYANSSAHTWKIIIQTHEAQRQLPAQRIHIDIANIPSHTASPMLIQTQYPDLPDGYDMMLYPVASREEILADKLIAIPARQNIKARDLWDVVWLMQQRVSVNHQLIEQKIKDHQLGHFGDLLSQRIESFNEYFSTTKFSSEMSRFLDSSRLSDTVLRPEFIAFVKQKVIDELANLRKGNKSKNGS